jgi:hypothetical protein
MKSLIILGLSVISFSTFAGDINWSGKYQIESQLVKNTTLAGSQEYSDFNHHLVLSPHIIAGDGITIHSRFDIFNNADYPNSQFGEFFGGSDSATTFHGSTGEMNPETLAVTELYLSWTQQFGSFIAGRAPIQFGLGITHNAGLGEFDHWFDRKDLVGYKFVLGNMFVIPMFGKVKEGNAEVDDDIKDYMLQFGYENFDTDLEIGFFYQQRKANPGGNDFVSPTNIYNVATTKDGTSVYNVKTYNLYVKKKTGAFSVGMEASMQSGDTGLISGAEKVKLDGSAIIGEIGYTPENSKMAYNLKLGTVSGDSSGSTGTYEGYLLDRNYDIALLLFNYPLGYTGAGPNNVIGSENYTQAVTHGHTRADVGQVTNALYFAPGFDWKWSDKWGMKGRLTYAKLAEVQQVGQSKELGYEIDMGIYYRPFERFIIACDTGYLMTGDAFKGGVANYKHDNAYGILTKAAITF